MKILAASSGGGHWIELLRLKPAFAGNTVFYCTVRKDYRKDIGNEKFFMVKDATQWTPVALLVMAVQMLVIVLRTRPDVVVTTGAAPGYFAIRWGKLLRARTVFIDSIANVDTLSKSAQLAGKHSDLWLTQWEELAKDAGPEFAGRII